MFYQIFLLPQEQRSAIITYKDGVYELRHESPINFSLNWQIWFFEPNLSKNTFTCVHGKTARAPEEAYSEPCQTSKMEHFCEND